MAKRIFAFLILGVFISTFPASNGWARTMNPTIGALVKEADIIALVYVEEISKWGSKGNVATGQVLEVWKGKPWKKVRFHISHTYRDDLSYAIPRETALLFLNKVPNKSFMVISRFGRGHLPLFTYKNESYVKLEWIKLSSDLKSKSKKLPYQKNYSIKVKDLHQYISGRVEPRPHIKNRFNVKGLAQTMKDRDLSELRIFLEKGTDVNAGNRNGITPLHMAASANWLAGIEFLIEHGADPQAQDTVHGYTPLMRAILNKGQKRLHVIRGLIEMGSDVNIKDHNGETALAHAKAVGHKSILETLKEADAKE